MNRRAFLVTTTAGVVGATTPAAAARRPKLLRGGRFAEGVMSGDPTPTQITLATRLSGVEGSGAVLLEIARDAGFRRVVTRSRLQTSASLGHAVKARVNGLKPHTRYWYRFSGRTADSAVGRFRTALPAGSTQVVQFGVIAGLDFSAGYFNAAALLANEDLDFVLNLGSYIEAGGAAGGSPYDLRPLSDPDPARSLAAYRRRYREYRADANLRRLHAALPFVSTWDDGEVEAGYAGADTGASRKSAAYRAWFEAMPHYPKQAGAPRVYFRPHFGRTLDLFVCDTRQYRRAAPGTGKTDLLGAAQSRFVRGGLKRSKALWKLVATPAPVAQLDDAAAGQDGWQGYQPAREGLLSTLSTNDVDDVVFLSAGRRRFAAADVTDAAGTRIAPEFQCGSATRPSDAAGRVVGALEEDGAHHGYTVCSVASDLLTVRFAKLATVQSASSQTDPPSLFELPRGRGLLAPP